MYPHSWSVLEVALLDVLEPLDADVVEEQEGALAHPLAMVVELTIRYLPLFRTATVVAMQCGGLIAVSHTCPITNKSSSSWPISEKVALRDW